MKNKIYYALRFFIVFVVILEAATAYAYFHGYRIGYCTEGETSIPGAFYLVREGDYAPERGSLAAFHIDYRAHYFANGTSFVKYIVGVPGDHVHIGVEGTTINGKRVAGPLMILPDSPISSLLRDYVLAPGHYFAVGTSPHSYDSRYWGDVRESQLFGSARILF